MFGGSETMQGSISWFLQEARSLFLYQTDSLRAQALGQSNSPLHSTSATQQLYVPGTITSLF